MRTVKIIRNSAACLWCGVEIVSRHRHDFVTHACKRHDGSDSEIGVDGGPEYMRRIGEASDMIDTSICIYANGNA